MVCSHHLQWTSPPLSHLPVLLLKCASTCMTGSGSTAKKIRRTLFAPTQNLQHTHNAHTHTCKRTLRHRSNSTYQQNLHHTTHQTLTQRRPHPRGHDFKEALFLFNFNRQPAFSKPPPTNRCTFSVACVSKCAFTCVYCVWCLCVHCVCTCVCVCVYMYVCVCVVCVLCVRCVCASKLKYSLILVLSVHLQRSSLFISFNFILTGAPPPTNRCIFSVASVSKCAFTCVYCVCTLCVCMYMCVCVCECICGTDARP